MNLPMPDPIRVTPENAEALLRDLPRLVRLALGLAASNPARRRR